VTEPEMTAPAPTTSGFVVRSVASFKNAARL
jgi:hypothetical protein